MNQNENTKAPLQLEAKAPSTPHSLDAVNMKREQNRLQDKHVIELLDKRRLLTEAQKQNDADLLFVGYRPPMEAPQPKRMTYQEWEVETAEEGYTSIKTDAFKKMHADMIHLKSEYDFIVQANRKMTEMNNVRAKNFKIIRSENKELTKKYKTLSNELRVLRKAKGYVSHKTVMNTLGKIKNKSSKKK